MIYDLSIKSEHKRALEYLQRLIDGGKIVEFNVCGRKMSDRQRRALHLYFRLLSEALNDAGFTIKTVMKKDWDSSWTMELVKELIWKKFLSVKYGKDSTTEMTTVQVTEIFDDININLGEKLGITVDFPDKDYGAIR